MKNPDSQLAEYLHAAITDLHLAIHQLARLALPAATQQLPTEPEYLSIQQLCVRIPYREQTIRNLMTAGELIEGVHYHRRRRRVMFDWPALQTWITKRDSDVEKPEPFYPVHHARTRKA